MEIVQIGYELVTEYTMINGHYTQNTVEKEIKYIDSKDIQAIKDKIKPLFNNLVKFDPTKKVYFTADAVFPRYRFKELSDIPVTRSIDKADIVVINRAALESKINKYYYTYPAFADRSTGRVYVGWQYRNQLNGFQVTKDLGTINVSKIIDNLQSKSLVLDSDLIKLLPSENRMDGNLYDNITKLLSSKDLGTVKIGARILPGLNYQECKTEIVLLLNQFWTSIWSSKANTDVAFKSMLNSIESDFPDWRQGNKLRFILRLAAASNYNPRVMHYVNIFLNSELPLEGDKKYKLIVE